MQRLSWVCGCFFLLCIFNSFLLTLLKSHFKQENNKAGDFLGLPSDPADLLLMPLASKRFDVSVPFGESPSPFWPVGADNGGGWFKKRFDISIKFSNWSKFTLVLPRYMNLFKSSSSPMLTPWPWGRTYCVFPSLGAKVCS